MNLTDTITTIEDGIVARLKDQIGTVAPISSLPTSQSLNETVQPSSVGLFVVFSGYTKEVGERGTTSVYRFTYSVIGFFKSLRRATDSPAAEAYAIMPQVDAALSGYLFEFEPGSSLRTDVTGITSNLSAFKNWYIYEALIETQLTFTQD